MSFDQFPEGTGGSRPMESAQPGLGHWRVPGVDRGCGTRLNPPSRTANAGDEVCELVLAQRVWARRSACEPSGYRRAVPGPIHVAVRLPAYRISVEKTSRQRSAAERLRFLFAVFLSPGPRIWLAPAHSLLHDLLPFCYFDRVEL
jgi:hypothetical protein